ncbi:spore germination protein [Bacillus sp. FJAT-44742]|uniref:spore germination protein n=1 Tax=Bacillus sp. FJAT-44742 TaxID=2014005 RepID=UPI001E61B121|nr:spore germination protein [Bacillus sp. FJAT-44742]
MKITSVRNKLKKPESSQQSSDDTNNLSTSLDKNVQTITEALGSSADIIFRHFTFKKGYHMKVTVIYTDGLINDNTVQNNILDNLMVETKKTSSIPPHVDLFEYLHQSFLRSGEIEIVESFDDLYNNVLSGNTLILLDHYAKCIAIDTRGWQERGLEEPTTETVVRGPKEGFNETLETNLALIRRRIKDPNLWIEKKIIGKKSQTDVAIVYLNNVASENVVHEVKTRIDGINIEAIIESGQLEELIHDGYYTPFPTIYNTERPDTAVAGLLEGRVAIVVDGTPFVLLVPALFTQFFQSPQDYYFQFDISSFLRILRYVSFFLSLLVPSFYIALTTVHQEMLPTPLLITLTAQREGVPFPAVVEAFLMELTFEILREAGVRMPRAVGSAISIVGALVIGQAAVEAGFVSSAMVIVVAITAIANFIMPNYNMSIPVRLLRFAFMIIASVLGLIGILFGLIALIIHLCKLRSFGVPYMAPLTPLQGKEQKDTILRLPWWTLKTRPSFMTKENILRNETPKPQPESPNN